MLRKSLSQDFESLFKDTDKNISSIKRQLGDKGRDDFPPRSPVHGSILTFGSTAHSSLNQLKSPLLSYSPPSTSQTTLITSMFKRLEQQSKTIGLLEKMIQNQNEEIQRIKDKQCDNVKGSDKGNNGFDFQSKLESVERELRGEIECIRYSMRVSNQLSERKDSSGDFKLQRRIIEDETNALKREVDSLKSRIERVESDINVSLRDTLNVNKKYGDIEKNVTDIVSNQKCLKDVTERGENQLEDIKKELKEISSVLCSTHKEDKSVGSNSELKEFSEITKADHINGKDKSNEVLNIADSPTNTLSILSNISDNNLSLNSIDISDLEKIPSVKESTEKCTITDLKHTSLLDDDDDDYILGFDSIEGDDLFLEKSSLNNLNLSDEESVLTDDLLPDDLL